MNPASPLAAEWAWAAATLHLDIVAPYSLTLPSGGIVSADVLVRNFGGPSGMLVIRDYGMVVNHLDELHAEGFGFSVMSSPIAEPDLVSIIEVLRDWGWTGNTDRPRWLDEEL